VKALRPPAFPAMGPGPPPAPALRVRLAASPRPAAAAASEGSILTRAAPSGLLSERPAETDPSGARQGADTVPAPPPGDVLLSFSGHSR